MAGAGRRADLVSGGVFLVLAVAVSLGAIRLSVGVPLAPGPGLYPLVLGIALGVASIVLLAGRLGARAPEERLGSEPRPVRRRAALVRAVAALCAYPALLSVLGYFAATFLFLLFLLRAVELKGWPVALATASLLTAAAYLVFARALGVPFPHGLLG